MSRMARMARGMVLGAVPLALLRAAGAQETIGITPGDMISDGACYFPDVEYAPRWSFRSPDDGESPWGQTAESPETCAQMCRDEPGCKAATWLIHHDTQCWLKTWTGDNVAWPCDPASTGSYAAIILTSAKNCSEIVYKAGKQMLCEEEKVLDVDTAGEVPDTPGQLQDGPPNSILSGAPGPTAAVLPTPPVDGGLEARPIAYTAHLDMDYSQDPAVVTEGDPPPVPMVNVTDLGKDASATPDDCADYCDALDECNAFLWSGDVETWAADETCYVKKIDISDCSLPSDAQIKDDGRVLYLRQDCNINSAAANATA